MVLGLGKATQRKKNQSSSSRRSHSIQIWVALCDASSHQKAGLRSARAPGASALVKFIFLSIQQNIFKMPEEAELKDASLPAWNSL